MLFDEILLLVCVLHTSEARSMSLARTCTAFKLTGASSLDTRPVCTSDIGSATLQTSFKSAKLQINRQLKQRHVFLIRLDNKLCVTFDLCY